MVYYNYFERSFFVIIRKEKNTVSVKVSVMAAALILLLAALICGACTGSIDLSPLRLLQILTDRDSAGPEIRTILFSIRLPRLFTGAAAGAALAVSGAILQGIMHNPLASPGIIGISAGGGLSAILLMVFFPAYSVLLVPAAFAGAFLAAMLVYILARSDGRAGELQLVLSGVAVSAMLSAFTTAVIYFNPHKSIAAMGFFTGSLASCHTAHLKMILPYILPALTICFIFSHRLNVLTLGDENAASLGLQVERDRCIFTALAAVLAAAAVSAVGTLGFAGLMAPHIVRLLNGADNRTLLPSSALTGAFLVVLCDTAGRIIMPDAEIPAGVLMALLGTPFFLWLLRNRHHGN